MSETERYKERMGIMREGNAYGQGGGEMREGDPRVEEAEA